MANVGEILDMVEIFCGKAGLDKNSINRALLLKTLNTKLAELHEETGWQGDNVSITTLANTAEYDLVNSGVPVIPDDILKVFVGGDSENGSRANMLPWEELERLKSMKGNSNLSS